MLINKYKLTIINNINPLKLVFKIAKILLLTEANDEAISEAKIQLLKELVDCKAVKTNDQRKALMYFLEYLFLIQDETLVSQYKEVKTD